jgi:hypothetical protein
MTKSTNTTMYPMGTTTPTKHSTAGSQISGRGTRAKYRASQARNVFRLTP